jgi:hypothetical protein
VARFTIPTAQLSAVDRTVRNLVRTARRLAIAAAASVIVIALLLWRDDGFDGGDAVLTLLLLTPSAIVLFFTRGVIELISLPGRMQRVPGESQEQLAELARTAGNARTARARNLPFLLWRLRGTVGSLRDVAGVALPFRVLTPGFLAAAAISALACVVLVCVGLVALIVLALG